MWWFVKQHAAACKPPEYCFYQGKEEVCVLVLEKAIGLHFHGSCRYLLCLPARTSSYVTDVRLYALNGVVPVKIQYHNKEDTHKENEKKKLQPFFTINKLDPWTHASLGQHQACTSAAPGSRKASLTLKELY